MAPAELREFVRLFNAGRYWDSHEALEALWRATVGPEREFYRGLIQAAAALVHHARRNRHGMRVLASKARRRLLPFAPTHQGIAVQRLLTELEQHLWADGPAPHLGLATDDPAAV
ncbi:MAG: DUF309 domain-containing protein [Fimbriimonadaceae bacterium]|nr:DUF309 domain-containing protein [Fimbriimonadaceae bacterium]